MMPSLALDQTASHLVPMATVQHHRPPGHVGMLRPHCSPYPERKPAPCGRRGNSRSCSLVAQTPPPTLPYSPEWPRKKNYISRILVIIVMVKCSPCCHLHFLCYGARVVKSVYLSPGQHSAAWEELWDRHTGGHTGITHSAPVQP